MDITNGVIFLTAFGAVLRAGGLWALQKPGDVEDIDVANFKLRTIEELPHHRLIASWGGGIPQHSDRPTEGPKGPWDNETEYFEDAMRRRRERAKNKGTPRSG